MNTKNENNGKRFTVDLINLIRLDNGKPIGLSETTDLLNSLHDENESLKKDIELYKIDNHSLVKQLSYVKTVYEEVSEELKQVKKDMIILEDDLLKMTKRFADLSRASNDKKSTPTQTTDDTQKDYEPVLTSKHLYPFIERLEKIEKAFKPDILFIKALEERLEKVENKLEQYFPEVN